MVYSVKCDGSIKGVVVLTPFLLVLVNIFILRKSIEETALIMIISLLFSVVIMTLILKTKYVIESERLVIIRVWGKKIILYEDINNVVQKEGKISIETPSSQQIWLLNENMVIVQVSPEKIELFEKNITEQLASFRKRITASEGVFK